MSKYVFFLLCISLNIWASEKCLISEPNELLELFKKNHPQVQQNNANFDSLKLSASVAEQRPNPEFDGESTVGDSLGSKIYTTSVSLKHTFELGGKRDARINFARFNIDLGKEVTRGNNEDVLIDSIVKLHRLRQIHEIIPIYKEAQLTFEKIFNNFNNRNSLSPEQQVEKETLSLAISDYKLNISQLDAEKVNLTRHLSFFLGIDCEIPFEVLPQKISAKKIIIKESLDGYAKLAAAKKNLDLANANYEIERSNSIPNLQVGPLYQYNRQNLSNTHSIGIGLTMDLPVLNINSAGRMRGLKEVNAAKIGLRNAEMESIIDLKSWETKYLNFSSSLDGIASRAELEKKHHKIEALFKRGIISTSLVIESHRQLISFYITRFNFEIGAVEALWNIHKINGELNEHKI